MKRIGNGAVLIIKSMARPDITSKSYTDFDFKLSANLDTLLKVNSKPLKTGERISAYN